VRGRLKQTEGRADRPSNRQERYDAATR